MYVVPFEKQLTWIFKVNYVASSICIQSAAQLPTTTIAKVVNIETRGFFFYLLTIAGNLGGLPIQLFGGWMYDSLGQKVLPFACGLITQVLFSVLLVYAILRKKMI